MSTGRAFGRDSERFLRFGQPSLDVLDSPEFVEQLKQTGEPVILTINGKAELIVQHAAAYQKLRQVAEEARALDGIRQGIEDMNAGRTVSLDEFREHARTKHGIKA